MRKNRVGDGGCFFGATAVPVVESIDARGGSLARASHHVPCAGVHWCSAQMLCLIGGGVMTRVLEVRGDVP